MEFVQREMMNANHLLTYLIDALRLSIIKIDIIKKVLKII